MKQAALNTAQVAIIPALIISGIVLLVYLSSLDGGNGQSYSDGVKAGISWQREFSTRMESCVSMAERDYVDANKASSKPRDIILWEYESKGIALGVALNCGKQIQREIGVPPI